MPSIDSRKRQKLSPPTEDNKLKRKHDDKTGTETPPNKKLQEFLDVMAPSGKSNTWSNADHTDIVPVAEEKPEDDEYIDLVPLKISKPEPAPVAVPVITEPEAIIASTMDSEDQPTGPVSDADWLRARTSRLLDITDDVSSHFNAQETPSATTVIAQSAPSQAVPVAQPEVVDVAMTDAAPQHTQTEEEKAIETIAHSGRLFVRNLPYSATEDELRQHFAQYGELQEVINHFPCTHFPKQQRCWVYGMTNLIGTTYCFGRMLILWKK